MEKKQIAVVGGGLAGTILAWQMYFNGVDFILFDKEKENTSSKIAPGIYNPIVFKRFIASWKVDELIPYLDDFYSRIEEELNLKFHFKINIHKVLNNIDEQNLWKKKSAEYPNSLFMLTDLVENDNKFIDAEFGFGVVKNSGYINTKSFLKSSQRFFKENQKLINYEVLYNDINNSLTIRDFTFNKLIFAEGYVGEENPFFPNLRYNFAKGEILTLKIENLNTNNIISKNLFILPISKDLYKVGSTFQWNFDDELPTEFEKNYLLNNLHKILKADYEIIEHNAGIRPATYDRRPFLGQSHNTNNLYIFNGMGAKSVLLAPYCSNLLLDNIINGKEIPFEININRMKK